MRRETYFNAMLEPVHVEIDEGPLIPGATERRLGSGAYLDGVRLEDSRDGSLRHPVSGEVYLPRNWVYPRPPDSGAYFEVMDGPFEGGYLLRQGIEGDNVTPDGVLTTLAGYFGEQYRAAKYLVKPDGAYYYNPPRKPR